MEEEDIQEAIVSLFDEINQNYNIIIINNFNSERIVEESILIHGISFELCTIVGTRQLGVNKWDGIIYSRHGGIFPMWWMDERMQNVPIQIENFPCNLPYNDDYTLVFVRVQQKDIETIRNQFLTNIGGQVHVQCANHRLPLIVSTDRTNKCSCGKKEKYRCCEFNCDIFLCSKCFESKNQNITTYIESPHLPTFTETNNSFLDADDTNNNNDGDSLNSSELDEAVNPESELEEYLNEIEQNKYIEDEGADNFDDFVMTSNDPDIDLVNDDVGNKNDQNLDLTSNLPTTNAGELALTIVHETTYAGTFGNMIVSGHVLLNQCGTLLTRKKHQIKGSSKHHFFLQKIVATCHGSSVPLMYPEGVLFPSIHWKTAPDKLSIVGCLPAPLLIKPMDGCRFASIQSHIRTRLTNPSCATSSDSRYCAHCYDMLTNVSANHEDTRMILNRGLTIGEDKKGGLGLRCKGDSSLLESVDNKEMVRNLCISQKYVGWDHFLTHTCNMKTHFGTAPIKDWLDSDEWKDYYPGFYDLENDEMKEIEYAFLESSASLLIRVWEEVFLLFIDYLRKSQTSPFKKLIALFARKEYQLKRGNLSHSHMMIALNWLEMTENEKQFMNELIRASIFDIVRYDEIDRYIQDGVFESHHDISNVYENAELFLPHRCNDSCLVRNPDGTFRCRKIDNVRASDDNTKHMFMPLPNDYSIPCLKILQDIGLASELIIDNDGNVIKFLSPLPFFHPVRHVPPTNPTNDMNISPVEGYIFANTKSMQNIQRLTRNGGCSKYVCKYIAKIDEQNYVVVKVDGQGQLVTQANFLHNTKVLSSKIGEDGER